MTTRITGRMGKASFPTCHARSARHLSWSTRAQTMIEILTEDEAKARGYYPLTRAYRPIQRGMWLKVLKDMERGGIECCLVRKPVSGGSEGGDFEGTIVYREN